MYVFMGVYVFQSFVFIGKKGKVENLYKPLSVALQSHVSSSGEFTRGVCLLASCFHCPWWMEKPLYQHSQK
jgi:hypothetical protein